MVFVFDIDDTVSKTDEYSEKYISEFFVKNNMPYKKIADCTRFTEQKFDWDRETAQNWYIKFGDEMMLKFPCKDHSIEIINKLYDEGHKIIFATARANDWHTDPETVTKKWLEINKIKYHKLIIGRSDKELICEEENADVFVDDDLGIISRVATNPNLPNTKAFLATSNYNKDLEVPEFAFRLNSFEELLKIL